MFDNLISDAELNDVLRATASADRDIRTTAITQFLTAITVPVREGQFDGDITAGIFNQEVLDPGVSPEYPLDFVSPGSEGEFRAFTNPGKGKPPAVVVSGEKLVLADIGDIFRVEYDLYYARNARWNVIGRLTEAFMAAFVKKHNDDCIHTILASMADRDLTVFDATAAAGTFTRTLFSNARCSMARNGGGNTSSVKRGKMTDIYISCEGIESILSWNLDQVPDTVRAALYSAAGGDTTTLDILGVKVHEMVELGANQEYQDYYIDTLGGSLVPSGGGHSANDVELGFALDLKNRDSFVIAITQPFEMFNDDTLHPKQKGGFYGWRRKAVGVLDQRRVLALSY